MEQIGTLAWKLEMVLEDHFGEAAMWEGPLGSYMMDMTEGEYESAICGALTIALRGDIAVPRPLLKAVRGLTAGFDYFYRDLARERIDALMAKPQAA